MENQTIADTVKQSSATLSVIEAELNPDGTLNENGKKVLDNDLRKIQKIRPDIQDLSKITFTASSITNSDLYLTVNDYDVSKTSTNTNVKSDKPNSLGIYGMTYGVEEWCWDIKGNFTSTAKVNPTSPDIDLDSSYHIYRYGEVYNRNYSNRYSSRSGFRIVRSVKDYLVIVELIENNTTL